MEIYADAFCNRAVDGPLWADKLTITTEDPQLTLCLQYTVLEWVPAFWLLVSLPYEIFILKSLPTCFRFSEVGRFNLLKTMLAAILAIVTLLDIIKYINEAADGGVMRGAAFIISPAVQLVSLLWVMTMMHYEFRKRINSSGPLFIFWFLSFVVSTVQLAFAAKPLPSVANETSSDIRHLLEPSFFELDSFRYATLLVSFILVFIIAFLHLFADNECLARPQDRDSEERTPLMLQSGSGSSSSGGSQMKDFSAPRSRSGDKLPPSPEVFSSFLLRRTYWWFIKMTWTGFRRTLKLEDCWDLQPQYRSSLLVTQIINCWQDEVHTALTKQKAHALLNPPSDRSLRFDSGIENPLFGKSKAEASRSPDTMSNAENIMQLRSLHNDRATKKKYEPSLLRSIWGVIGPLYLLNAFLKLVYDLMTFVQPVLLNLLVAVVTGTDPIQWHGFALAGAMFVTGAVRSLILAAHFHTGMMCGLKVRTAMTGLVYRKALLLSTSGKKDSTVGEIVNLMSVDIQRIQDAVSFINLIWSSPLVIVIALVLLYAQLGAAAFAGLAVMLLLIPINMFIATSMKKYQAKQMVTKDERIKLSTEILNGMKVLKLYGWEMAYRNVIEEIRDREVHVIRKIAILSACLATAVFISPFLVAACSFIVYAVSNANNVLTANIISVSLSLINIMNFPISFFPQVVAYIVQVSISMKRLCDFLLKDEILPNSISFNSSAPHPIQITDGTFSWGRDEAPFLKKMNLTVRDGALLAIVGTVGAGKSSLLHAVLGEMHRVSGDVTVRGRIAYVPQQAWLVNASIQDNIVFGMEFSKSKYDRVVQACALEPDFKVLPNGDQTEVGERGINMSGGQKQRISLARAVYQNADIYVLDDPLSAVDSHVAKHIFEQVLGPSGLLAHKTRVLVTHAVNILPKMEQIVVMKNGEMTENGAFDELLKQNGGFADFIREFLLEEESEEEEEDAEKVELKRTLMRQVSALSGDEGKGKDFADHRSTLRLQKGKAGSVKSGRTNRSGKTAASRKRESKPIAPQLKLIQDETSQVGSVKWDVYGMYFRALALSLAFIALIGYAFYIGFGVGTNIWLSFWSSDSANATANGDLVYMRMGVYVAFGFAQMLAVLVHSIGIANATTRASKIIQRDVLSRLLRSPMSFFDTTPLGRITNRISKDLDTVDIMLPMTLRQWLISMAVCAQTIVLIIISNVSLVLMLIPVVIIFVIVQRFYINTSRQLKRIDSVLRSPIFAHFQNSLLGLTSIRAYKITDRFSNISDDLVDRSMLVYYPQCVAFRWLGVSLDSLSNLMIFVVGLVSTASRSIGFDASLASLAITYTTTMSTSVTMAVRSMTDLETYVVSIERLKEYTELDVEAPLEDPENLFVPQDWPARGKVEFSNYSVRYRSGLDLVLRDVTCTIQSTEKVGIVGRTGAGKSSLSLALFRILEPANGTIIIDGIDITRLGLQTLRSRVTIIPQEPVLFSGSLRRNIDPFGQHSDGQIWQALECSHLKAFVKSQPAGLDFVCSEGGENLSVGQRQLLCMARAVLRRSKILLLDEATAAVDVETDQLIQKTIREEFRDCTILTIAHRLNTVLDYDKILVLDQGRVKEYDSPNNLLADKSSIFYSMAKDAGLVHD